MPLGFTCTGEEPRIAIWLSMPKRGTPNALDCFEQIQHEGILPNAVTYACILKACATIRVVDKGKQIHDKIAR